MADRKEFRGRVDFKGQVDFTDDTQIKIAGVDAHGPTGILYGRNETDKADPYQQGTTQLYPLGTELVYGGRHYRYAKMGSSGVTQGKLLQLATALHADSKDLAPTADTAAGSKTLSVELGSGDGTGDIAANFFADGFAVINDGAGEGFAYKIKSHPAVDVSEDNTIILTLYDAIQVALVASADSKVDLFPNPYANVELAEHDSGTFTGQVVGATAMAMSANNFGWIQTKGVAAILTQGAIVLGHAVVRAASGTNGAVQAMGADFVGDKPLGKVLLVAGSGEYSTIDLDI